LSVSGIPTFLTSFLGRDSEVQELGRLLHEVRLLTLTGVGGVGKTRLAAVVAHESAEQFGDGVWFVELAPLTDPALVVGGVARALGVLETPGRTQLDAILAALRTRQALLVLDNCEHVLAAAAELVERLLGECARLTILATSRAALNLAGEQVWRVPPLSWTAEGPRASAAVRLFVDRARAVLPSFDSTSTNGEALTAICQRLDGIPLAIELAAARASTLTVHQIAERLDDRFRLLTASTRSAPSRQQTLRATVDWSYLLLDEAERRVLRRLSVFAGGWSLDAAEAVCQDIDVLDRLLHLVDRSMVQADVSASEARYHLLETLRQYALEKLAEDEEIADARQRHAEYFVSRAEHVGPELVGRDQAMWLRRLDPDHENFHVALVWYRERDPQAGLRLALGVWPWWRLRGYMREGRQWLEELLGAASENSAMRAAALHAIGELALRQGDLLAARAVFEASLELYRVLGDVHGEASTLERLGLSLAQRGGFDEGRVLIEAGLSRFRRLGDARATGWTLSSLGMLSMTAGNSDLGQTYLDEALELLRGAGDQFTLGYTLGIIGQAARGRREYEVAVARLQESIASFNAIGDRPFVGWNLANLGDVYRLQGDFARARATLSEALLLLRDVGSGRHVCSTLVACAALEINEGFLSRGVTLSVAAMVNYPALRSSLMPDELADWDGLVQMARRQLGDDAFGEAWALGEGLALEQAIALAVERPARTVAQKPSDPLACLSPRQHEVALLVARGLSNKEVAAELVLSERTVEAHVTHTLNKLGVRSRAQLAVLAAQYKVS
jgi:predicted ATPase/DNA-binding CsgD family transcriptional regulator